MKLGGWWRLWIAFTAIYGIIVAIVTYSEWPGYTRIYPHPSFIYRMSPQAMDVLIQQSSKEELEQMLVVADRSGNVDQARKVAKVILDRRANPRTTIPLSLEMPNGHIFKLAGETSEADQLLVAREYTSVVEEELRKARAWAAFIGFIIWIGPALIVAALGLLSRWVYHGFRKPQ